MSTKIWHIILLLVFLFFPKRYKAITLLYAWFRVVDDVIDEELEMPTGYDVYSYIQQKQSLIDGKGTNLLKEDIMYLSALQILSQKDINLNQEIKDLLLAMKKEYFSKGKFVKRAEFESKILLQDRAVLTMLVKVHSNNYGPLDPILFDFFTRVDALMDIEEDIKRGVINIPLEDAISMGINIYKPLSFEILTRNKKFREWYIREVDRAIIKSIKIHQIMKERQEFFLLKIVFDILGIKNRLEALKKSPFLFLIKEY
ncbi:MAG: class 1 isoprenoid biosynthesis enzyme [Candidatus Pacebacteria bacterium]|nr:class 1 isoprenoid biosynthesis enzyme [Candidatus Paceibacterota bacterium]